MPERRPRVGDGIAEGKPHARQTDTACDEHTGQSFLVTMEEVLSRENMLAAYRRVVSNKGAPGVDGVTVEQLETLIRRRWEAIREELLNGCYVPSPVRKVEIPKPGGQGVRMLGIPTALDRLIQQALLQVLTPLFDPTFSESSFGFRPGRSAHQALDQAKEHIAAGHRWVVDMDLEKFFDRVNHDVLMSRLARRIKDKVVNRDKSAVDRPWKRKFLGYTFTVHYQPKFRVSPESVKRFKSRLRELFRQGRGRSLRRVLNELRPVLIGWVSYYRKSEVRKTFEELDQWIRRKLRAILWRHWKRNFTRARELIRRGLTHERAWISATNGRGPWWNAGASHMNQAVPTRVLSQLGLVSLSQKALELTC